MIRVVLLHEFLLLLLGHIDVVLKSGFCDTSEVMGLNENPIDLSQVQCLLESDVQPSAGDAIVKEELHVGHEKFLKLQSLSHVI
jgi:hypothetical protein